MALFLETALVEAESIGSTPPGGKILGSRRRFSAQHGLGVAWAGVENKAPEPLGFRAVAALFGENGEVAQGEVAVDALIHATELVGALKRQDPPPACCGLGGLARFAVEHSLTEMDLGVVGVEP